MKLLTYLQTHHHLSRRKITALIKELKISVNGTKVAWFGHLLEEWDSITIPWVLSQTFSAWGTKTSAPTLIWLYKPSGYVVSKSDRHNATIYEILPPPYQHYYPIGRLDKESTGLLILSNDPALVHELSHPSKLHTKIYHITVHSAISPTHLKAMRDGIYVNHEGGLTHQSSSDIGVDFLKVSSIKRLQDNSYELTLTAGKNRHIRRMCRALWYRISILHRVQFGKRKLEGNVGEIKVLS